MYILLQAFVPCLSCSLSVLCCSQNSFGGQKLSTKEYNRLAGKDEEHNGEGSDDENGEKKKKAPNLSRLLKTRLQKLVDRTDDKSVFLQLVDMKPG